MASPIPATIVGGTLIPTGVTVMATGATGLLAVVKQCSITNVDTAAHVFTLYLVRSGQSIGNAYKVYPNISIPAGSPLQLFALFNEILNPGDTIQAMTDTTGVLTLRVSGFTMSSSGS